MRNKFRKGFIKPKIVPPFHSHKITKPHVSHFVSDHDCSVRKSLNRNLFFEYVGIINSNATYIFHCSHIVFWTEDLIILVKRVRVIKQFIVVHHRFPCNLKQRILDSIQMIIERISDIKGHRYVFILFFFFQFNNSERSGGQSKKVSTKNFCFQEIPNKIIFRFETFNLEDLW